MYLCVNYNGCIYYRHIYIYAHNKIITHNYLLHFMELWSFESTLLITSYFYFLNNLHFIKFQVWILRNLLISDHSWTMKSAAIQYIIYSACNIYLQLYTVQQYTLPRVGRVYCCVHCSGSLSQVQKFVWIAPIAMSTYKELGCALAYWEWLTLYSSYIQ